MVSTSGGNIKKKSATRTSKSKVARLLAAHRQRIYHPRTTWFERYIGAFEFRVRQHQPLFIVGAVLIVGFLAFYLYTNYGLAISDTLTVTTQADWEAGEYWDGQLDFTSSDGDLKIASGNVGSWDVETPGFPLNRHGYTPQATLEGAHYGADLTTDGTYLYAILGGLRSDFFRYNPELGIWKQLNDTPTPVYYGGAITYEDGYVYLINGNYEDASQDATSAFYRYAIATDTWERLADAPEYWGRGSDIASGHNGMIYAVRGLGTDAFWAYNIGTNMWSNLPSITSPYQVYVTNSHPLEYSNVSYAGPDDVTYCENGCLYAFRGNNQVHYFRYDIALNLWKVDFSNVPTTLGTSGRITTGSAMTFDSDNGDIYAFTGGHAEFMKYEVATETWDTATGDTPNADMTIGYGAALVYIDDVIYGFGGTDRKQMIRYDVSAGTWTSITHPLATSNNYDSNMMAYVPPETEDNCTDPDGCLYVAQGRGTTTFYRYDISARTWTTLNAVTGALSYGGGICYDGNDTIYAIRGGAQTGFYSYSIDSGDWSTLTVTPAAISYGGGITCHGDGDVFVQRGNGTTATNVYRWTGSWSATYTVPGIPNTNNNGLLYGANIVSDGTYVYMLAGNYRGQFFRLTPGTSTWDTMASYPTSSYYTTILVYDHDALTPSKRGIIALPGMYGTDAYRYNISTDTWNKISDMPDHTLRGQAAAHDNANGILYVRRGFDTETMYKFNTEDDNYIPSATWISGVLDLTYATSFNSFSATDSEPGTTSIDYYSRTSDDQVEWSDWATISGSTINSPAHRYIQIKVILNSDGTNTPSLSDFTINFEKDSVDPTNPSVSGYADSTKASGITSPGTYYHTNPYFEFSGAADAQSGLDGYYVQWTDDANDDPDSSEDNFQTAASYTVSSSLESGTTYYLRIAARDQAGNVATPVTAFTYTYNGISPASVISWTDQADFEASGTTASFLDTSVNTGTDMTLEQVSGGVWTNEAPAPFPMSRDATMVADDGETIYYLESNNTQRLWAYSVSDKTYTQKANFGDVNVRYGSAMIFVPSGSDCTDDDGCLYALAGNSTTYFKRYNISANTWTTLDPYRCCGELWWRASV